MSKTEDFANENPTTDKSIVASFDVGLIDNDVAIFIDKNKFMACTTAWTGWYRHPRGGTYKICKDNDGYLVHKPGGGNDAWGNGYT